MSVPQDGGPAFGYTVPPQPTKQEMTAEGGMLWRPGHEGYVVPGMSLRDWFAGQALVGFAHSDPWGDPSRQAFLAYQKADAFLEERRVAASEPRSAHPGALAGAAS